MINTTALLAGLAETEAAAVRGEWDQGEWETCFAAMVCTAAGGRWAYAEVPLFGDRTYLRTTPEDHPHTRRTVRGVSVVRVWDRARTVLGLEYGEQQADDLFRADATLERLRWLVREFVAADTTRVVGDVDD